MLTKWGDGDIIYKLSRRAVLRGAGRKRAGSLKIEQQASYKSMKIDVYRDSEILLKNIKNSKQVKSKQDRSDEKDDNLAKAKLTYKH